MLKPWPEMYIAKLNQLICTPYEDGRLYGPSFFNLYCFKNPNYNDIVPVGHAEVQHDQIYFAFFKAEYNKPFNVDSNNSGTEQEYV